MQIINETLERKHHKLANRTSMLDHVGNTPLLPLHRVVADIPASNEVYVKAEWHNPSGSVKDRPAAAILRYALSQGYLHRGIHLLDSTSGNMGISYATLAAPLGVKVHLAIPANASPARLSILRALGAELTLTDPLEGSDGARVVAADMAERHPERYYFADQYNHPMNWQSHYQTTGPEILNQTEGRITHFVAGLGTSGTMMGVGRFLKEHQPDVTLIAVQPEGPLHGLEGLKHMATSPTPGIFDPTLPDRQMEIATEDAYQMVKRLAREEGLLVGISAGAAMSAGLTLARQTKHASIVVILPDSASKYMDLDFWRSEG